MRFAFGFSSLSGDGTAPLAHLQRLVSVRWLVAGAALILVLVLAPLLAVPLPRPPMLLLIAVIAAYNLALGRRLRRRPEATPAELLGQIAFDILSLAALLFFSGGATNPLIFLLLPPVALAALILPPRHVLAAGLLALAAYSLLMVYYLPLPLADPARATRLHLVGMWLTFAVSAALIAGFVLYTTTLVRQRDAELAAAREQAMRAERVVALGTLAAGAAHELGTPLATMAVIAGELEHEASLCATARADVALLRQQIGVCKEIITGLSRRAGAERLEEAEAARADLWLDAVIRRWQSLRPQAGCRLHRRGAGEPPCLVADPTLEQAVVNLLNNGANAGPGDLELSLDWNAETLAIEIRDHGHGFAAGQIERAGLAPWPAHAGGSGIGLVLTRSAVERAGGRLSLANHPAGGALARIELPLAPPPPAP